MKEEEGKNMTQHSMFSITSATFSQLNSHIFVSRLITGILI